MIAPSEIAQSLKIDRSKANVNVLTLRMAKEHFDFKSYLDEVESTELPVKWYLTWTLSHYYEQYPVLKAEHQSLLWAFLLKQDHEGIQRDLWRLISFLTIDEELSGLIYDKAIKTFTSAMVPIAIRAHAMQTAFNIAKDYAELCDEMTLLLEEIPSEDATAIRARGRNLLQKIKRIRKSVFSG